MALAVGALPPFPTCCNFPVSLTLTEQNETLDDTLDFRHHNFANNIAVNKYLQKMPFQQLWHDLSHIDKNEGS